MSGFAFPAPLNKTNNTGLQSLTGVQQTQPGTQLTSSLMTTGGVTAISALGKQLSEFSRALGNDQEARTGLRAFALESGRNQFAAGGLSAMADLQSMRL
ncbi:MAG TPA: hypothetical protein PKM25_11675, partial [Candidatus Ozemobacteraceae bacterium]|nr:hypothetical protein [Candidatus Ozemobacteraceae bacterium]